MSKIAKGSNSQKGKEKTGYQVTNWSSYNQSLVNRGNITLYFEDSVLENWYDTRLVEPGGQYVYSDLCIESLLMLKVVFKLTYRQTEGFSRSLLCLMGIEDLDIPCYTQMCRRAMKLDIAPFVIPRSGSLHIAFDSTGVKIYGEGEWKVRKHGYSKRRTWRKLHLGVDPKTGFIHAHTLTENYVSDGSQIEPMLDQIAQPVKESSADGAYDQFRCWEALEGRKIKGIIPPRENAVYWADEFGELLKHQRNDILKQIDQKGMKKWKEESGYHQRSLSETAMFRFKTIHGPALFSRKIESQKTESAIKIKVINIMTAQGMPQTIKVKYNKTA